MLCRRRETFGTWWRGDIIFWLQDRGCNFPSFPLQITTFAEKLSANLEVLLLVLLAPCSKFWALNGRYRSHLLSAGPPDHTPPWSQPWHSHLTFTLVYNRKRQVPSAFSISFLALCVCVQCVGVMVNYGKHAATQTTITFNLHLLSLKLNVFGIFKTKRKSHL